MNTTQKGIPRRLGIALVATSLLWSEAAVWSATENSRESARYEGSLADIAVVLVFCAIPSFLFALLYFRERWSLAAVLLLLLGPVRCDRIDHNQIARERWQACRPALNAKLAWALKVSVAYPKNPDFSIQTPEKDLRIVIDGKGHRWVSFIQVRGFIDNGMAYVYDPQDSLYHPQDSLYVEVGKADVGETRPSGLGHALSGFGIIGQAEPLGDHWYRVYFT